MYKKKFPNSFEWVNPIIKFEKQKNQNESVGISYNLVKFQTYLHRMSIILLFLFNAGKEMDFQSFGVLFAVKSILLGKSSNIIDIVFFFKKKKICSDILIKDLTWIVNATGIGWIVWMQM